MFSDDQLKRNGIDTLKLWTRHKLDGYRIAVKDMHKGNLLFRGVYCPVRPKTIKQISYPPLEQAHELIKKPGRINRIGQSVFYCSAAAPAVFYELRAKQGDTLVLSEWEVTESLWMHNLGFHAQVLRQMGTQDDGIYMRNHLINPIINEPKENKKIRKELSRAFTADVPDGKEYRYKQSIAIAELFLDGSPLPQGGSHPRINKAAGIVYPTMKMRGDADNAALLPEFVESSLRIKSARYIRVEAVDEKSSSYTLLTIGLANTFSDGHIQWHKMNGPDADHRSHIALENGHWVLRDGYNRIYDLH